MQTQLKLNTEKGARPPVLEVQIDALYWIALRALERSAWNWTQQSTNLIRLPGFLGEEHFMSGWGVAKHSGNT